MEGMVREKICLRNPILTISKLGNLGNKFGSSLFRYNR